MEKDKRLKKRLENGSINQQSIWKYIRERNSADPSDLSKTAVIDCTRTYTYAQMFGEWERYAQVFSALGMTEKNGARVGIAGSISAEPLFAFYGLNMTGAQVSMLSYPDFLPSGHWKTMVEKEKLTDLVLSDIMITPDLWPAIEQAKEELGLRNVILVHSRLGGPCTGPAELVYDEYNFHTLQRLGGTVFMDDLLKKYAATPINYGSGDPDHLAIITHTSGTTKGTRKPLPYTDRSVNTVSTNFKGGFRSLSEQAAGQSQLRLAPSFDFSSFLCMCGVVNSSLAIGDTVVLTFFGFMHPKFIRAIEYYKLDVVFTSGFMIDSWMERSDIDDVDFSSIKVFSCGGSYLPPDKLRKYTDFVHRHGYSGYIQRGYGMSETGGAQLYVPNGCMDDILGFPTPRENFLIQDENDGKYYVADDGIRTGVMYIASDSLCMNELDGEVLFEYTEINGRPFICTNDLVRVNSDGSFSYAGRADRYFVNNEGVRFHAGTVETELSRQPGIGKCAVVPVLDKRIHDTVPAIYIVPESHENNAPETVRQALVKVFLEDGLIRDNSLPSQFILVDDIPCNSNGKLDIYRITRDRLNGRAYNILPVRQNGKLTDIGTELTDRLDSITGGTLPEGMGENSALGIYELFNAAPDRKKPPGLPELLRHCRSLHKPGNIKKLMKKTVYTDEEATRTMFDFFDNQKNPFMFMMNMMGNESVPEETPSVDNSNTDPMQFMQQMFMMQMQLMQTMMMLPMQFMQKMADLMNQNPSEEADVRPKPSPKAGFKMGNLTVPPELLAKLMQMEMSPENLKKLQGVLDFVFESMPNPRKEETGQEVDS